MDNRIIAVMLLLMAFAAISTEMALAQQTGALVTNVSWSMKNSTAPQSRNDSKGTITTVTLTAAQQNNKWKAYVGNVSSTFVLDDSGDYSIYRWTMDSFAGQVYITRNQSITWGTVLCATPANKVSEDTALNHNSTKADSVNRTFASQIHKGFSVGTISILNSTCYATSTYVQNTTQAVTENAFFQEVLLWDGDDMIYTTFVENDKQGYGATGVTYDFQAIVPDDGISSNPALRYYFYLELT